MKHVLALLAASLLVIFAGAIVWIGRAGLTHFDIIAAGCAIAFAFAIAIPADFGQALATLKPYLPLPKGPGGAS